MYGARSISTGDFSEALAAVFVKDGVGPSASTIGRLKDVWQDEHAQMAEARSIGEALHSRADRGYVGGGWSQGKLLLDLKRRGLQVPPELAIADGGLGFWKAAGEVWPKTRDQRCWVHK